VFVLIEKACAEHALEEFAGLGQAAHRDADMVELADRTVSHNHAPCVVMMADSTVTKAAAAQLWKLPPIIKIYEAAGAIGDGRLELIDETRATVTSSDGAKTYEVAFDAAARTVAANDNASYWQGYLGYPGIAMLLLRGVLEVSRETAAALRGIAWKELNRRFKND